MAECAATTATVCATQMDLSGSEGPWPHGRYLFALRNAGRILVVSGGSDSSLAQGIFLARTRLHSRCYEN